MSDAGHNPCATCGACCRNYVVPLCGRDVWAISTQQRLDPEEFVTAFPLSKPAPDAFQLNGDSFTFVMALNKQGEFIVEAPCTFLVQLGGGHARCGIYAHRPVVCQSYPMIMFRETVIQRKDSLCPPNSWSAEDVQRPAWRAKIQHVNMSFDIYHEVVARWNARVMSSPTGTTYPLKVYFDYLMNVYDQLGGLEAEVGAETLERVEANWGSMPESGDLADESLDHDQYPWIGYLGAAREVIDGFYPGISAQPSVALMTASGARRRGPPRHMIPDELLVKNC